MPMADRRKRGAPPVSTHNEKTYTHGYSDGSSIFVTTGRELIARFWHLPNDILFTVNTTTAATTATLTTTHSGATERLLDFFCAGPLQLVTPLKK